MSTAALEAGSMRTDYPELFTVESPRPYPHGSSYKEETIIGNGAYGTVYKACDLKDPTKHVALKKVRIPLNEDGVPVSILREIALVRQLERFQHPNVVRFLDVCHGPRTGGEPSLTLFLVFEFVEMDLGKYIQTAPVEELTASKIKDITFQLLCGVDFLHSQRIVHRDLKPQNLLISKTGQVKLADFGLAKIYDFTMRLTSVVVTLWYRSPEVLLGSTYGTPVDLWSVGCIFAELYRRRPIFPGESERSQIEKIFDVIGSPRAEDWPTDSRILPISFAQRPPKLLDSLVPGLCSEGKDLLSRLLAFLPLGRLSAREALSSPYFAGLSPPCVGLCDSTALPRTLSAPTTPTNNNKAVGPITMDPSTSVH